LRRNTEGCGSKAHHTDSQNSDGTAPGVRAVPFVVLAPGGQSGNFWLHPNMFLPEFCFRLAVYRIIYFVVCSLFQLFIIANVENAKLPQN